MKAVKLLILFVVVIFTAFFYGCIADDEQKEAENSMDTILVKDTIENTIATDTIIEEPKEIKQTTTKDYTAKYICPMHCSKSGSNIMGDCPECGMELIENPN